MNRARRTFAAVFAAVAGLLLGAATTYAQENLFPRPAELEPQVQFWTRVYTEVDTHSGFIHDDLRMDVVYQTIKVQDDLSRASAAAASSAASKPIATSSRSSAPARARI